LGILEETTLQAPCEEPQISLHALSSFSAPQTLEVDWLHQEPQGDCFD
jgi:hypothetical protein